MLWSVLTSFGLFTNIYMVFSYSQFSVIYLLSCISSKFPIKSDSIPLLFPKSGYDAGIGYGLPIWLPRRWH